MDYSELTEQQYNERLRMVIVGSEGLHPDVQDIGDRTQRLDGGTPSIVTTMSRFGANQASN